MNIHYRPISPQDERFLLEVYASTRAEEMSMVSDWDENQKSAFVAMQFSAQHQYYQEHYHGAEFLILLRDQIPIGRLYLARWQDEIRIVDLAILPAHRNAGVGTTVLKNLLAEAQHAGKPLRIHVEKYNPALRLYQRLGFKPIVDRGVYWFMERAFLPDAEEINGDQVNIAS